MEKVRVKVDARRLGPRAACAGREGQERPEDRVGMRSGGEAAGGPSRFSPKRGDVRWLRSLAFLDGLVLVILVWAAVLLGPLGAAAMLELSLRTGTPTDKPAQE